MDTFDDVYVYTVNAYTGLLDFVSRIDLGTRVALIAILLSVMLNIYTAHLLWSNGVRDMGKKQRKREKNTIVADRVCDVLEDLRAKDVITDDELRRYYISLSRSLRVPDLRFSRTQPPWVPTVKERLVEAQLEQKLNGQLKQKEKKFTLSLKNEGTEKPKRKFIFRPRAQA